MRSHRIRGGIGQARPAPVLRGVGGVSAPAPDLLTRTEVLSKLRVAAPTLRRWCRARHFPEPLQLGPNCLRWVRADVEAWLASRRRVIAVIESVAADRHRERKPHIAGSSSVNRL